MTAHDRRPSPKGPEFDSALRVPEAAAFTNLQETTNKAKHKESDVTPAVG
jgi:hypothetical protein